MEDALESCALVEMRTNNAIIWILRKTNGKKQEPYHNSILSQSKSTFSIKKNKQSQFLFKSISKKTNLKSAVLQTKVLMMKVHGNGFIRKHVILKTSTSKMLLSLMIDLLFLQEEGHEMCLNNVAVSF